MAKLQYDGPVVLAILDGVGLAPDGPGNAVFRAKTDFLATAAYNEFHCKLNASGEAVGLTPGQMGNSEVGHSIMGCGQIVKTGLAHIEDFFATGQIWETKTWREIIEKTAGKATLHFVGIFSDGGVHSHIDHLEHMIKKAIESGVQKVRIHTVFDGRDVPPQSEPKYIERIEEFAKQFKNANIKIASGGGRMVTVSDRYENDWAMVERGFNMMVKGLADNYVYEAKDLIERARKREPEIQDQYLPTFVVVNDADQPIGKVEKGDAVICYDFRADRALEITKAFTEKDFTAFSRGNFNPDDIYFAGLTEYEATEHIPKNALIPPVEFKDPLNQFLGSKNISELAVSETVKFGHVTYYFNGCSYEKAANEDAIEIESDNVPFETRPQMKATEITDAAIANLDKYKFIRLNYPNGDMVGHSADFEATKTAMEAVDANLARLAQKIDKLGGCLIITADHGNAEELLDENGEPKTAHSTNKVPFIIYDKTANRGKYGLSAAKDLGLSNVASTIAVLLGQEDYPAEWRPPIIHV